MAHFLLKCKQMHIYIENIGSKCARSGFTLIELLVVIVIISILAAVSAGGVKRAKEMARQTDCMSNLRQIGVGIVAYRNDHAGRNPDWTSCLYPTYIDDLSVYVCRSDINKGRGRTRPEGIVGDASGSSQKYPETVDNVSRSRPSDQNSDVEANSYFYEFSSAKSPWAVPNVSNPTWADYKEWELREGNNGQPFSSSKMPIVRCYHHALNSTVPAFPEGSNGAPNKNGRISQSGMTLNVAYAGNVVIAPLWWQGAVGPEDKK